MADPRARDCLRRGARRSDRQGGRGHRGRRVHGERDPRRSYRSPGRRGHGQRRGPAPPPDSRARRAAEDDQRRGRGDRPPPHRDSTAAGPHASPRQIAEGANPRGVVQIDGVGGVEVAAHVARQATGRAGAEVRVEREAPLLGEAAPPRLPDELAAAVPGAVHRALPCSISARRASDASFLRSACLPRRSRLQTVLAGTDDASAISSTV